MTTQQIPPGSHQAQARLVPGRQHSTSCSSTGLLFSRWAPETDFQPAESRELAQKPPQPPSTAWSLPLTSNSSTPVMFMLCHTPSCHQRNDKCIKKQGAALGGCLLLWLQTIHLADQNSACLSLPPREHWITGIRSCYQHQPARGRPGGLLQTQQEHFLALLRALVHFVTLSARKELSGLNFVEPEATS